MFGPHVLVAQPLRFFRGAVQDALALRAQRHFHRRGNPLADRDARLDLFSNGFDRTLLPQESVGERLVFPHQSQQQMLGLDVRAPILAGLVPGKENYPSCFFCISFKHVSSLLPLGFPPQRFSRHGLAEHHARVPRCDRTVPPAPDCASRLTTSGDACGAAAATTRTQPKHSARLDLRSAHQRSAPAVP